MPQLSVHFHSKEFACKDGCGYAEPRADLVQCLERLRTQKKVPIRIVSGCRCAPHNESQGGARRSRHVYGQAADLPESLRVTQREAERAGFNGIGLSKAGFVVHVDTRPGEVTTWTY